MFKSLRIMERREMEGRKVTGRVCIGLRFVLAALQGVYATRKIFPLVSYVHAELHEATSNFNSS